MEQKQACHLSPLRWTWQRIYLYESKQRFYLVGSDGASQRYKVLKITRGTEENPDLEISEDPAVYTRKEMRNMLQMISDGNKSSGGLVKKYDAYGLIGFIRFTKGYYLILITQRKKVGTVGPHAVYSIEEVAFVPLFDENAKAWTDAFVKDDEARYRDLFQGLDLTKDFYFSYTYDLSYSLQSNMTQQSRGNLNEMFVWNSYLLAPFLSCVSDTRWVVLLIHGYFGQSRISIFGRMIHMIVIARRSRYFAGTRFLKRGVTDGGYVANDVETEQIVYDATTLRNRQLTGAFTACVQIRGSIPLHWSQEFNPTVVKPKPDIVLGRFDPTHQASVLHFQDLHRRYSPHVHILNLVKMHEKKPREMLLGDAFKSVIDFLNARLTDSQQIRCYAFDFRKSSKSSPDKVINDLTAITESVMRETGFFATCVPAPKPNESTYATFGTLEPLMTQRGVLRTNCIDCLDRTNIAQFVAGKCMLGYQLHHLGVIDSPQLVEYPSLVEALMSLYDEAGDRLALQYGGSRTVSAGMHHRGLSWDVVTSVHRFYSNTITDSAKQDSINLILGNYIPGKRKVNLWELDSDYYLHSSMDFPSAPSAEQEEADEDDKASESSEDENQPHTASGTTSTAATSPPTTNTSTSAPSSPSGKKTPRMLSHDDEEKQGSMLISAASTTNLDIVGATVVSDDNASPALSSTSDTHEHEHEHDQAPMEPLALSSPEVQTTATTATSLSSQEQQEKEKDDVSPALSLAPPSTFQPTSVSTTSGLQYFPSYGDDAEEKEISTSTSGGDKSGGVDVPDHVNPDSAGGENGQLTAMSPSGDEAQDDNTDQHVPSATSSPERHVSIPTEETSEAQHFEFKREGSLRRARSRSIQRNYHVSVRDQLEKSKETTAAGQQQQRPSGDGHHHHHSVSPDKGHKKEKSSKSRTTRALRIMLFDYANNPDETRMFSDPPPRSSSTTTLSSSASMLNLAARAPSSATLPGIGGLSGGTGGSGVPTNSAPTAADTENFRLEQQAFYQDLVRQLSEEGQAASKFAKDEYFEEMYNPHELTMFAQALEDGVPPLPSAQSTFDAGAYQVDSPMERKIKTSFNGTISRPTGLLESIIAQDMLPPACRNIMTQKFVNSAQETYGLELETARDQDVFESYLTSFSYLDSDYPADRYLYTSYSQQVASALSPIPEQHYSVHLTLSPPNAPVMTSESPEKDAVRAAKPASGRKILGRGELKEREVVSGGEKKDGDGWRDIELFGLYAEFGERGMDYLENEEAAVALSSRAFYTDYLRKPDVVMATYSGEFEPSVDKVMEMRNLDYKLCSFLPGVKNLSEIETALAHIVSEMRHPTRGVPIADRVRHKAPASRVFVQNTLSDLLRGRVYPKCFLGCEAVDWVLDCPLIDVQSREDANHFLTMLFNAHVLHHVTFAAPFADARFLYRFQDDVPDCVLNMTAVWDLPQIHNATEVSRRLMASASEVYKQFAKEDGSVDSEALMASPRYLSFERAVGELQRVNISNFSHQERLGFFINVHNTLFLHAYMALIKTIAVDAYTFCNKVCYNVAGYSLSLNDIKHGILRGNKRYPGVFQRFFRLPEDTRSLLTLCPADLRIHFVLSDLEGRRVFQTPFETHLVEKALRNAAEVFCATNVRIDVKAAVIVLTPLFARYREDFGSNEQELVRRILRFVTSSQRRKLIALLGNQSVKIVFRSPS